MKKILILMIILQLNNHLSAQTNCTIDSKKGLFVELFGNKICNNETLRTNLENYIIRNGYNFILLYGLGGEIFNRKRLQIVELFPGAETNLKSFIRNLKARNSNIQIGAVDGSRFKEDQVDSLNLFFNNVDNYNSRRAVSLTLCPECIDFIVLEDEYWSDPSIAYTEYTDFVQPIMETMKLIAHPTVPVNWPSPQAAIYLDIIADLRSSGVDFISQQEEVNEIDDKMDKIILTTYITDPHLQGDCGVGISALDKLFMPTDIAHGDRLQLFAQNSKPTHILELFSSESSDPTLNLQYTFDFMGKYLWWNGLVPETVFHTGTVDDMKTNFETNYSSLDPNFTLCNGPLTLPFCTPNTSICACTDHSNQSNGNIIDGIVWFKYGTMPFKGFDIPLYVSVGTDVNRFPLSTTRITLNDNFNDFNPIVDKDGITRTISSVKYNWYKNGVLWGSTFSPFNYIDVPAPADGVTDTWTGELVSNFIKWFFMNNFLRDDINIIGSIGICEHCTDPYAIFTKVANPTCPNYNNGSLTASIYYGTGLSYLWSNGATTQTISGLSPGSYSVTISGSFGTKVQEIDLIENRNLPEPFVLTRDLFSNCSPNLETQSFASYQWNLNGQPISTANSQSYLAATPGEYSVTVTNSSQCSATSPVQIYNPSFSLSIVGKNSTCNNRFLGFSQNIVSTSWSVPSGATFVKSGNLITVNWGNAYLTGGVISCTATNDCGNTATSSIQVSPFLATVNSTASCSGLNNGKANVSTLTGGTAPYTYHWNSGTNTTSQLMTNLSAGIYTVTVTDNNNCTTTASTVVNSFPSDMPAPIISGLPYSGAHLYTITNYNSAYDNYYSWNVIPNFGNATISYPNNNKESAIIVWPISGGVIHLTFGLTGCQLNTNFIVSSSYPPLPPNPKQPVKEFIERLPDPSVKSSDFTESADAINSFKLFPNPTTGKISLNYNLLSTENGLIEITNILGVSLYYKKLNPESQQLEIDLSELKPAIYFFKIVVDGKQIHQGKISIIR